MGKKETYSGWKRDRERWITALLSRESDRVKWITAPLEGKVIG